MIIAESLKRLLGDKRGTTAIEYALICGLIVLAMLVGFKGFGSATIDTWTTVSSQMETAVNHSTGS